LLCFPPAYLHWWCGGLAQLLSVLLIQGCDIDNEDGLVDRIITKPTNCFSLAVVDQVLMQPDNALMGLFTMLPLIQ